MKAGKQVENSGAVVYVGNSHLTVHNPLLFVPLQSPPSVGDKIIL